MEKAVQLGPYRLERRLGSGGMGAVWRAVHEPTMVPVAVKLLAPSKRMSSGYTRALRQEIRSMAKLDHPNIARVLDQGVIRAEPAELLQVPVGSPFFAMELLAGGALSQRGRADWRTTRRILSTLLDALAHAHAHGVVHRDVKPHNVLLPEAAAPWDVRLTDFGIASAVRGTVSPRGGTPRYMPPEQAAGRRSLQGPTVDLYALGRVALWLLTGSPAGVDAPEERVPVGFEEWLNGLLAHSPEDRFQRAADANAALGALGEAEVPLAATGERVQVTDSTTMSFTSLDLPQPEEEEEVTRTTSPETLAGWVDEWREATQPKHDPLDGVGIRLLGLRAARIAGRLDERERLWSTLKDVWHGQGPRAVVVVGEPGSGRHALVEWFSRRAQQLGLANGVSGRGGSRRGLVSQMVWRWLRVDSSDPEEAQNRAIEEADRFNHEDPLAARALVALVEGQGSQGDLRLEWGTWLGRLAKRRPLVVSVHEPRPSDGPVALATTVTGLDADLLLVLTATPTDPWLADLPDAIDRIDLQPMSDQELSAMLDGLLPLDPELRDLLVTHGRGSPGRLLSLLQDVAPVLEAGRRGMRMMRGHEFSSTDSPGLLGLEACLGRGSDQDREALEIAAIAFGEIDEAQWREVCRRVGCTPSQQLVEWLCDAGVAQRDQDSHPWRWQDRNVARILEKRAGKRSVEHRLAWVEVLSSTPGEEGPCGVHLAAAGRVDEALTLLVSAAFEAQSIGQFDAAETWLQHYEDAVQRVTLAPNDPRPADALIVSIRLAISHGRLRLADSIADQLLALSEEQNLEFQRAMGWWLKGRLELFDGRYGSATKLLTQTLQWANHAGDKLLAARGRFDLGQIDFHRGRVDLACERFKVALEEYTEAEFLSGAATVATFLCHASILDGDMVTARDYAEHARQAMRRAGAIRADADYHMMLGAIAHREEEWDSACAHLREAARLAGFQTVTGATAVVNLALVLDSCGRCDEVRPALEPGLPELLRMKRYRMLGGAQAILASAAAELGEHESFDAALDAFDKHFLERGHSDADVADTLRRAAERAGKQGWHRRMTRAQTMLALMHGQVNE